MSTPYIGEIRLFAGNFAPVGWAFCKGQLLAIDQADVLFQLIGTTYGGDGQQTFALPDLRGRLPVHQGQGSGTGNHTIGETGGTETVTLTVAQIPAHSHMLVGSGAAASAGNPAGAMLAATTVNSYDSTGTAAVTMAGSALGSAGGNQPHENMAPTLTLNYIISLFGIFPTQT